MRQNLTFIKGDEYSEGYYQGYNRGYEDGHEDGEKWDAQNVGIRWFLIYM